MRGGGGRWVGEGEFKRMAHTGGVCIDMNGMFEREKGITEGSGVNKYKKEELKIKYRGLKGIFKVFVFG